MKLEQILKDLNSFEKNSFLKILETLKVKNSKNSDEINKIMDGNSKDFKNSDSAQIAQIFKLIENEYTQHLKAALTSNISSQIDILTDILIREGNSILAYDHFSALYKNEFLSFEKKKEEFFNQINDEKAAIEEQRKKDYRIYTKCLETAYKNDIKNNLDCKVTSDEMSILLTLSQELGLSLEEVKFLNYEVVKPIKKKIEEIINDLKEAGIIFYLKKTNTIYVADEIIRLLRKIRGQQVSAQNFRRVLRLLREPQINMICKKHNIDWHQPLDKKIKDIINEGVSFVDVLANDIFKSEIKTNERKQFINSFCDDDLKISPSLKGATIEDKLLNLVAYFENIDEEDVIGISHDGYEKLLSEIVKSVPTVYERLTGEFDFEEDNYLKKDFLLARNIKPRGILEIIPRDVLEEFCEIKNIKTKGNIVDNILNSYKDSANLYLENYDNIAKRDLNSLKNSGIQIEEAGLGLEFENLTKIIFKNLGYNVNDELKFKINTDKDKIDILISLDEKDNVMIIECKTAKEDYNKFSSVKRQLKSYVDLAKKNNLNVRRVLLVAPDFTENFVKDCSMDTELELSLITSSSLLNVMNGFKNSTKYKQLPFALLSKDWLLKEENILRAIEK